MRIPLYQIDAFASAPFHGNPAAVCPVDEWPSEALMQSIASENNLSETAFLVREGEGYRIRWFTPTVEVDLCGHATLAAAWVVFNRLEPGRSEVSFHSRSGPLRVAAQGDMLALDFPARAAHRVEPPDGLVQALGCPPGEVLWAVEDYMAVYASEEDILALRPDFAALAAAECRGVIVTAPGANDDFVSRFFAPRAGIPEDPVTGSAHCALTPYWAERLGKRELTARQLSARGGELECSLLGERVVIAGRAVLVIEGELQLP